MVRNGSLAAMSPSAVECRDLVVRYGARAAVDGLSLTAERGQVLALLGPNGAGKTSTVETLEGYRRAAAGTVRVLGLDPASDHRRLVARMGVMLQRGGVYPVMGPRRVLRLFADYYDDPEDPEALLDLVGLRAVARTPWRRLSGGEQQRLSLALALVGRPEVVFLDEPTAGVDPEGRITVRRVVTELRHRGACVVLTTHELPEAERLADEVVIIARGSRRGPRHRRRAGRGGRRGGHPVRGPGGARRGRARGRPRGRGRLASPRNAPGEYRIAGAATATRLALLAGWMHDRHLPLTELRAGRRSLEEIYLRVTKGEDEHDATEHREDVRGAGGGR